MNLLPEERSSHINYGATAGRGQSSMDAGKQGAKRQCAGTWYIKVLRLDCQPGLDDALMWQISF